MSSFTEPSGASPSARAGRSAGGEAPSGAAPATTDATRLTHLAASLLREAGRVESLLPCGDPAVDPPTEANRCADAIRHLAMEVSEVAGHLRERAALAARPDATELRYIAERMRARGTGSETLDALADEVHAWQCVTFPAANAHSKAKHLEKEAKELAADPTDPEEMADIFMLLVGIAKVTGIDLAAAVRAKLEKNRTRVWGEPDADGVVEHVRGAAAPDGPTDAFCAHGMYWTEACAECGRAYAGGEPTETGRFDRLTRWADEMRRYAGTWPEGSTIRSRLEAAADALTAPSADEPSEPLAPAAALKLVGLYAHMLATHGRNLRTGIRFPAHLTPDLEKLAAGLFDAHRVLKGCIAAQAESANGR